MQLQEKRPEFDRLNVEIAVVTFEDNDSSINYPSETGISWPLLIDGSCELYQAYGMQQAGFFDLWGPATWKAYLKELFRGRLPKKPTGDIHQRGGDVLIGPDNIVRLHHVGKGPADRPAIDSIINIVSSCNLPDFSS